MKIRNLILTLVMAVSVNAQQTESYSTLWGRVEMAVKKDLPKTVVAEAQLIYNKAEREKNVPQMIKAYLTSMQYRSYLSYDYKKEDIAKLKQWAEEDCIKFVTCVVLWVYNNV